jgi:hypothetical protein
LKSQALLLEPDAPAAALDGLRDLSPDLVFAFFSIDAVAQAALWPRWRAALPGARWIGCSTAGEIGAEVVTRGKVALAALRLERTPWRCAAAPLAAMNQSRAAGADIGRQLAAPDLAAVIVFGPGVDVNGSALIEGLSEAVGPAVIITGGLAGDDGTFERTWTLLDDRLDDRQAVAVGFYGTALRIGHGSFGGWQPFGPVRTVTRAEGNLMHELDGEPALEIYRRYLGDHARGLPASGLLFPFAVLGEDHREIGLIRTILGIDEATRSLVLAGDIAQGGSVRLMHASTNALIDGAQAAASAAATMLAERRPSLALLVSCVGRKLMMGGRVDEEVEAVARVLGQGATITGFYSNGEISPLIGAPECRLHNQTMTITCLSE